MMDEGLKTFVAECNELLEEMESSLLKLESSPSDTDAVNSVFRAAHTIKGSAGVVGIDNVQAFTHKVENVLDLVRQGEVGIDSDLIGLMLECRDHIAALVSEALGETQPNQFTAMEEQSLTERLNMYLGETEQPSAPVIIMEDEQESPGEAVATDNWHISLRFGPDVMRNGMDPVSFLTYLTRLGEIVFLRTIHHLPPAEAMDPETCYLGFEIDFRSESTKAGIEDVFEFVQDDCKVIILPPRAKIGSYIKLIKELPEDDMMLGEMLLKGGALTEKEMRQALEAQEEQPGRQLGDILVEKGALHQEVLEAAVRKQQQVQQTQSKTREASTIRVDTRKLDVLINTVGELVISGANIRQEAARIKDRNLTQSTAVMLRLIEEIRESAMSVRMMPLWDTFNRFKRVVRDICADNGKDIELEVRGGDTELDRTVIERIRDPLMHLVRNAADHGIESPEERRAAGKPATGAIAFNAYQETGDIIIEVRDDGSGIDRDRVLAKAVDRGIIRLGQELSEQEVLALVFAPGFSTATQVTNISGRGVGMDVVKRNIEALRGTVEMESAVGVGTTVRIRLPLTLAIIDGFLVEVAKCFYVVPIEVVTECLALTEDIRKEAHGRDHVNLRGKVLPYVRLREVFQHGHAHEAELEHILVVKHAGRETGFLVDRLHGEVQSVVKNLGRLYRDVVGISGATIMGDGTVALILDVPELVRQAIARAGHGHG